MANETIADIIAHKRQHADYLMQVAQGNARRDKAEDEAHDIRREADRIEAAWKREKAAIEADALAVAKRMEEQHKRELDRIVLNKDFVDGLAYRAAAAKRERMVSRVMFHATPKENVESIMEKGIVPQHSMVYLSHRPNSWASEGDGRVVLMVCTDGLDGKFSVACGADDLDEVIYWGTIPPDNIMIPPYGKRELSKQRPESGGDFGHLGDAARLREVVEMVANVILPPQAEYPAEYGGGKVPDSDLRLRWLRQMQTVARAALAATAEAKGDAARLREALKNIAEYVQSARCHTQDAHVLGYLDQITAWAESARPAPQLRKVPYCQAGKKGILRGGQTRICLGWL